LGIDHFVDDCLLICLAWSVISLLMAI